MGIIWGKGRLYIEAELGSETNNQFLTEMKVFHIYILYNICLLPPWWTFWQDCCWISPFNDSIKDNYTIHDDLPQLFRFIMIYHDLQWFSWLCLLKIEDIEGYPSDFSRSHPPLISGGWYPRRRPTLLGCRLSGLRDARGDREAGVTGSTWSIPLQELVIYPIN
jgi:hypothetical protein